MTSGSPLRIFTLEYNAVTNSIFPHVRYISPDNVLKDLYNIINCELVTCTKIEVNGKLFDVYSDDEALLKNKPAPNLYIDDDLIILGQYYILILCDAYGLNCKVFDRSVKHEYTFAKLVEQS